MRTILLGIAAFTMLFAAKAQAPAGNPVPTKDEPHHHLVLENAYVRVFHFELPGHEATLLHSHDLPYVSVALGPGDFVNAVAGKPEAHVTLKNEQVGYSKGGFAHIVRTDAGAPFQNFTVELLKPQGSVRNLCVKVVADAPDAGCRETACIDATVMIFDTDEMAVASESLSAQKKRSEQAEDLPRLYLVLDKSELTITIPGLGDKTLHTGEAFWLPAGAAPSLENPGANQSRFLVLTFK
ncbi:MAG TPA: hypothetical protein VMJ13_02165 [Candidatus Acidoferrum sp.]|nr:hypothetical protein [Candidatus Acidoferrum sp.]